MCMKTGGKYFEEYRFRKKDGSYFHAEDSSIYLLDEKDQVHRIVGVIKDINERKLAREIRKGVRRDIGRLQYRPGSLSMIMM